MAHSATKSFHLSAPGLRSQSIEMAPDAESVESSRYDLIEDQEKQLRHEMVNIEEGTKARNREYAERLEAITEKGHRWLAKMRTEVHEAEEANAVLQQEYQKQIEALQSHWTDLVNRTFDQVEEDMLPVPLRRCDVLDEQMQVFVNETVPRAIDKKTGAVTRKLHKAHETFEIEQQKTARRERKIVKRASEHIQLTAQRFEDERATSTGKFHLIREDINEDNRRTTRVQEQRIASTMDKIRKFMVVLDQELAARQREDCLILDYMVQTQQDLQNTILTHFGSDTYRERRDSTTAGSAAT